MALRFENYRFHELNYPIFNAEGNSCSLPQFMTRSDNSCNLVAIHCVFSVKDNTHNVVVILKERHAAKSTVLLC